MANQNVSPEEAKVAQVMLETMPPDPEPRFIMFPNLFINGINITQRVAMQIIQNPDGSITITQQWVEF